MADYNVSARNAGESFEAQLASIERRKYRGIVRGDAETVRQGALLRVTRALGLGQPGQGSGEGTAPFTPPRSRCEEEK
jgi:hypothetical protein